jgi:hypothetical protein
VGSIQNPYKRRCRHLQRRPGGCWQGWQGNTVSNAPAVSISGYMESTGTSAGGNSAGDRSHEVPGHTGAPRRAHRARTSHPEPPNRVLGSAGSPFEGDGLTAEGNARSRSRSRRPTQASIGRRLLVFMSMLQRAMRVNRRLELLGNETDDKGHPVRYTSIDEVRPAGSVIEH